MPTFASLAGAEVPEGLDGVDFSKVLKQGEKIKGERMLYWEFHELSGNQAVRKGKWKAVRLDVHKRGFHNDVELYDLSVDPSESNDLSTTYPDIKQEMTKLMDSQHVISPLFPFEFQGKDSEGHH